MADGTPDAAPSPEARGALALMRCTAEDDPCYAYARRMVVVIGARTSQPEISAAANDAYLADRAKAKLHDSAGGTARRGAKVGDDVLVFIGRDDRGYQAGFHHHRDDATAESSVVVPAKVHTHVAPS